MDKKTVVERLESELNEADDRISRLEAKIAEQEYKDNWHWRMERELTPEENMGMIVPRLEMRYRRNGDAIIADYALVREHFLGHIVFSPLASTKMHGYGALGGKDSDEELRLPHREGAHMYHDMWHFKMPGYVVNGKNFRILDLEEDRGKGVVPLSLYDKMERDVEKKEASARLTKLGAGVHARPRPGPKD